MPQKLTKEIIDAAIFGFEAKKRQIDAQIAELRAALDGHPTESAATSEAAPRKRKKFSAASRRKMALAQTARWAKIKGESEPAQPAAAPTKPKRKLSAAARAKLVANLKKARAAKAAKAKSAARKTTATAKKAAPRKTTTRKAAKKAAAPATAQAAS